jgi:hypothetical protein
MKAYTGAQIAFEQSAEIKVSSSGAVLSEERYSRYKGCCISCNTSVAARPTKRASELDFLPAQPLKGYKVYYATIYSHVFPVVHRNLTNG